MPLGCSTGLGAGGSSLEHQLALKALNCSTELVQATVAPCAAMRHRFAGGVWYGFSAGSSRSVCQGAMNQYKVSLCGAAGGCAGTVAPVCLCMGCHLQSQNGAASRSKIVRHHAFWLAAF